MKRSVKDYAIEYLQSAIIAVIIVAILNQFIMVAHVDGPSMFPTLESGNYVIFNRINKEENLLNKIVAVEQGGYLIVKRIIAVGNEVVEIKPDGIYVKNEKRAEAPPSYELTMQEYNFELSADEIFLLGDNMVESYDSRKFGPVKLSAIQGKYLYQVPLLKIER